MAGYHSSWETSFNNHQTAHLIDCKTAVFFANASDGPYSNERSRASEKNGEGGSRASRSRITLTAPPAFRKRPKTTVLQSTHLIAGLARG